MIVTSPSSDANPSPRFITQIKHKNTYAILKGCRERGIVRPHTPIQITPELPTVTVFYSGVARNLVGSREKQCGDDLNTAVGIGNAVIVTALVMG